MSKLANRNSINENEKREMKVERANVAPWVPNLGRDHLLHV